MKKFYYLFHIQYLGFRFHGWQKQKNVKTVHLMIDKTINFVLGHDNFKTLGTSRTDAMVSANHSAFELFMKEEIDVENFFRMMNSNLPSDIRITEIKVVDSTFNIINTPKIKEYIYLFSHGEKVHPFSSAIMASFTEVLDVELMKQGAKLFLGSHYFKKYATKPSEKTIFNRVVLESVIEENKIFTANFFPNNSFVFRVKSEGFLRNQIRLMMGQLLELGRHNIELNDIDNSLKDGSDGNFNYIAPASGLMLYKIEYL